MKFKLSLALFLSIASIGLLILPSIVFAGVSTNVFIDQFGYRTVDTKVAVFAQPAQGYNSPSSFTPGSTFQVINASSGATVFTGTVTTWNGGNADTGQNSSSGDKGWWGDFSSFTAPGTYYINVPGGSNPGSTSYNFTISDTIYNPVLQAVTRMYLYQRCGVTITAAEGGNWNHPACHEQESSIDLYDNTLGGDQGAGTARNVTGGWHDAGDYNKYVPFTSTVIWDLLHAYEWNPCAFGDNWNIPESGNGVPDILDEIKWELDWIQRMQITNTSDPNYGACYSVVGELSSGANAYQYPPNNDTSAKNYTNISSFATSTLAMDFADAARIFENFSTQYPGYSAQLQNSAVAAWNWLSTHSAPVSYDNTNFSQANANGDSYNDFRLRVAAAAELFRLTGNAAYQTYFDTNYNNSAGWDNGGTYSIINSGFWATNSGELERAMVDYCLTTGATAAVTTAIANALVTGLTDNQMGSAGSDLYRAYMWSYYWGSNQGKATWGNQLLWAVKLNVSPSNNAAYLAKAEDYLHYFHGVNPNDYVYLTNTGTRGANIGASNPIMSIYHSWFEAGTTYDGNTGTSALGPAPGYLSGGPNPSYAPDASYGGTISPPQNQPPQKSYKDWGITWPQDSWEVTEPGIYYQAAYVFLCSAFATCGGPTPTPTVTFTQTASPTGTLPTNTFTPTVTVTPTITLTFTPTATYCIQLFNGCESLAQNGTWSGTNATQSISTTDVTQGTYSLQVAVTNNPTGGWNDQVFDLSGFTPTNWSNVSQLMLDINVPAGIIGPGWSQLFLYADSAPTTYEQALATNDVNLVAGENLNVTFNISLTGAFTPSSPITKLYFIYNSNAPTGTGTYGSFYVDNIRLVQACGSSSTSTFTFTTTYSLTPTKTPTPTLTPTMTPTLTFTYSYTPTMTPTITATPSLTPTPTPQFSYTPTNTPTITNSPTDTFSSTPTNSFTSSLTPTATYTLTPTPTLTLSLTSTSTPTTSNTPTITNTPTNTLSPTFTNSPTPTLTPTVTYSPTPTFTASYSPTPTSTPTKTNTPTITNTPSNTLSPTSTFTPTFSWTTTATKSSTPTQTATYSPTLTSSATLSYTPTITNTATNTLSPTSTFSPTQSWTPTATHSPTPTPTVTLSPTPTFTVSPTPTATLPPTLTPTITPTPPVVPSLYPNPVTGNTVTVYIPYGGDVEVDVYTLAFRKVITKPMGQQPPGITVSLALTDNWGGTLADGLYYVVVKSQGRKWVGKMLVLR